MNIWGLICIVFKSNPDLFTIPVVIIWAQAKPTKTLSTIRTTKSEPWGQHILETSCIRMGLKLNFRKKQADGSFTTKAKTPKTS